MGRRKRREKKGQEGRRAREKEVKSTKPQGYIMEVHEASMEQASQDTRDTGKNGWAFIVYGVD